MKNRQFLFVCAVAFINPWFVSELTQTTVIAAEVSDSSTTPYVRTEEKVPILDPLNPDVKVIPRESDESAVRQIESSDTAVTNSTEPTEPMSSQEETTTSSTHQMIETTDSTIEAPTSASNTVIITEKEEPLPKPVIKKKVIQHTVKNESYEPHVYKTIKKKKSLKKTPPKKEFIKKEKVFLTEDFFKKTKPIVVKPLEGGDGNDNDESDAHLAKLANQMSGVCLYGMKKK
ncbi:hypothetical protein [Vagococcus fessus]|uniref:hypothetical protein n=1 Tax=Vagococcus fessus TaxID=120370 RepID=UPI0039EA3CFA